MVVCALAMQAGARLAAESITCFINVDCAPALEEPQRGDHPRQPATNDCDVM